MKLDLPDIEDTAFTAMVDDLIDRIESGAEACEYDRNVLRGRALFERETRDMAAEGEFHA